MLRKITEFVGNKKLFFGIFLWIGSYFTLSNFNAERNRKVYLLNPNLYFGSQNFLKDFELEKKKLGLEHISILHEDDYDVPAGLSFRLGDGKYLIRFNPECKSKELIRHELYHVKKWEEFSLDDLLDCLLLGQYEELRATNYSIE